MKNVRKRRLPALTAVAVTALSLTVAGCGAGGGAGSGATLSPEKAAAVVSKARVSVEAAMESPPFRGPTAKIDMTKLKGKTIWAIQPTLAIPLLANVAKGVEEAGAAAGVKVVIWDSKGDVSEMNKGFQLALAQGADGIILQAIDPRLVSGPLAAARKANIPVVDAANGDVKDPLYGVFAHVTFPSYGLGALFADYIITESKAKADVAAMYEPKFTFHRQFYKGMERRFKELCPTTCKVTGLQADSTQIAQQGPSKTVNALRRDPNINWLVAVADFEVRYMISGMRQINAIGKVRLVGHDAVDENLDLIRKGEPQEMDNGFPPTWWGWAQVDQVMRGMAGQEPVDENVPYRLFTKANLPDDDATLFGTTDFKAAYKSLWQ